MILASISNAAEEAPSAYGVLGQAYLFAERNVELALTYIRKGVAKNEPGSLAMMGLCYEKVPSCRFFLSFRPSFFLD